MASIYQRVNDICRNLVQICLSALEIIKIGSDAKSCMDCARKVTEENIRLLTFIRDYVSECVAEKEELYQKTLLVKEVVIALVEQLRTLNYPNAPDIEDTIADRVGQLRNDLKVAIKQVGLAAHQLSLAEAAIPNLSRPTAGLEEYAQGFIDVSTYSPEHYAIACLEALAQMCYALDHRNLEEFTTCTRNIINLVNKLISIRQLSSPPAEKTLEHTMYQKDKRLELRQNLVSLISHSKMYFVNPDDEFFQINFYNFKEKVEIGIKGYLPEGFLSNIHQVSPHGLSPSAHPEPMLFAEPEENSVQKQIPTRENWVPCKRPLDFESYVQDIGSLPKLNYDLSHKEDEGEVTRLGSHRNCELITDVDTEAPVEDDSYSSDYDMEMNTNCSISEISKLTRDDTVDPSELQFAQSIIEKIRTACPNDWEHMDLESKEALENQMTQVLFNYKQFLLTSQDTNLSIGQIQNPTANHSMKRSFVSSSVVYRTDTCNSKPAKSTKFVHTNSVIFSLKNRGSKTQKKIREIETDTKSPTNIANQVSDITCLLLMEISAFVTHFNDTGSALDKSNSTLRDNKTDLFRKRIYSHTKKLFMFIKESVDTVRDIPKDSTLEKVKQRVVAEIDVDKEGTIIPIDEKSLCKGQYCRYMKYCTLQAIYNQIDAILNAGSQFATLLRINNPEIDQDTAAFSLLVTCSEFYMSILKVLNDIETYYHLLSEEEKLKKNQERFSMQLAKKQQLKSTIWSIGETDINPSDLSTKDLTRPGTLDTLIVRLTASTFSADHLNAFLSGYELFTSPLEVWEKLEERYFVPKDALPNDQAQFVKMRTAHVILHWIKKDFHSIDPLILNLIEQFASSALVEDNFITIAPLILQELEALGKYSVLVSKTIPKELKFCEDPHNLLWLEDKVTIAEQLTLIDIEIYCQIAYSELTDLKWSESKEKYHIIARNILNFIKRSNYLSHFIAQSILLQKKLKDRAKMVVRVIRIAKTLCDMHNYHGMMGILAGLGQAAIDRLKLTWGKLAGSKHAETYKLLQQYFSPGNSFKLLREELKKSGGNALPYVGCILSDLTFMDEGNPNFILEDNVKLINFPKHHLINRSIKELQQFQKTKYNFTIKEPLYTFLHQMPVLQGPELFALSLDREPRQVNQ